jgi:hypothetical protein
MTATFTISSDNNITAFATPEAAQDTLALGALVFTSKKDLTKLASDWPAARLVEIWNGFAGVAPFADWKPVKKFTDRKTAVERIWQAIQKLAPAAPILAPVVAEIAPPAAEVAHKKAKATKAASTKDGAAATRGSSKKAIMLDLLRRKDGATLTDIAKATDWKNHSIRGFISGTIGKKMGLKVQSAKNASGDRTYRIG